MAAYRHLGDAGPFYPDRAGRAGVSSVVVADCRVLAKGRLDRCEIVGGANLEYGFGFAVQAMAKKGWMTAGPQPEGVTPPPDSIWRFKVEFPRPDRYP